MFDLMNGLRSIIESSMDIEPKENANLSKIMQWILSVFAVRYNKLFNYKGHVWYDRFKSKLINSLLQYIRTFLYIANNPVRAGLADHPLKFAYSGLTLIKKNKWKDILDPPPKWLKPFINRFLDNFSTEGSKKNRNDCSFQPKKSGKHKK